MSKRYESNVKIVDYRKDKPICCDESSDPEGPFCFFYATFFKKVLLHLPLSIFEKELLTELNVTPARLHPNSWAFIRAFIILCAQFDISSSVEVTYCGCPWTVPLEEPCFPSSSLHIRIWKENLLKFEPQQEFQPFWMDFPYIGPLSQNSRVFGAWKIYHQKIKGSTNSYRVWRSSLAPPT